MRKSAATGGTDDRLGFFRLIGSADTGAPIDPAGVRNNDAWKDADDDSR